MGSESNMKGDDEDMLAEDDLTGGVRGKYADRYRQGTNVVLFDPDVAAKVPSSQSVNEALRRLARQGGG
jgi:hypothetical protein